jgi:hypothetical protein
VDLLAASEQFVPEFQQALGPGLVSVSLHGLDTRLFWPAHCLVVLTSGAGLQQAHGVVARWRRRGLDPPLFLARHELERTFGLFPLELLNLGLESRAVLGEDPLAGLEPDPCALKDQCERELAAKAVVLRRAYSLATLPEELAALIQDSLPLYLAVFRGLLHLAGQEPPLEPQAVVSAATKVVALKAALFEALIEAALGRGPKRTQAEMHQLVGSYLAEADRLARLVGKA